MDGKWTWKHIPLFIVLAVAYWWHWLLLGLAVAGGLWWVLR